MKILPTCIVINGISIEMRVRENGHNIPHVHAKKNGQEISISLDGRIIVGKFKNRKDEDIATEYVKQNQKSLEAKWKEMH